jgi:hypothetical protein
MLQSLVFFKFLVFIELYNHPVLRQVLTYNFRPARPVLRDEAGGHFSLGPDLAKTYSAKINQDW